MIYGSNNVWSSIMLFSFLYYCKWHISVFYTVGLLHPKPHSGVSSSSDLIIVKCLVLLSVEPSLGLSSLLLAFTWRSLVQMGLAAPAFSFHSLHYPVSLAIPCLSLSVFSSPSHPPCFFSFHLPSMHAVCVLLINMSLCSASRCLRQAFLCRKLLRLQSCLLSSIHLSIPLLQGFVLSSATINLLANRQQSCRLGGGIRFLDLEPPKNVGAWN